MCVFPPQWCNNSSLVTHVDVLHSFTGPVHLCVYVYVCVSPPQEERLTGDYDCTLGRFRFSMSLLVSTEQISLASLEV